MRTRKSSALLFVSFLLAFPSFAAAQARFEKIAPPSDVPAAIANAVEGNGAKLVRSNGSVLCEIWLAKSLPSANAKAAAGAAYPELAPGAFLGVISFPHGGTDFRGQPVKGAFTMRYHLLPEDGNHLGVAPTSDFVLLLRAADDPNPKAQLDFGQLAALSEKASGTSHPAVLLLLAPQPGVSPRTFQNPDGYQVFAGTTHAADAKPVPIALVIKGQAEQ